jgi:hypothetical protein
MKFWYIRGKQTEGYPPLAANVDLEALMLEWQEPHPGSWLCWVNPPHAPGTVMFTGEGAFAGLSIRQQEEQEL